MRNDWNGVPVLRVTRGITFLDICIVMKFNTRGCCSYPALFRKNTLSGKVRREVKEKYRSHHLGESINAVSTGTVRISHLSFKVLPPD